MPTRTENISRGTATTQNEDVQQAVPLRNTAKRMPLVGHVCIHLGQLSEVMHIGANYEVTVRNRETGQLHTTQLSDLIAVFDQPRSKHDATKMEEGRKLKATQRAVVVRELAARETLTQEVMQQAARDLSISIRQLWRLLSRFRSTRTQQALQDQRPGRKAGRIQLDKKADEVIAQVIKDHLRKSPDITISQIYPLIEHECRMGLRMKAPSRATVVRRLSALRACPELLPTEARLEIERQRTPIKAHYGAEHPLQTVQIDHTVVDVMCVDPRDRKPIGRPTLTIALDLFTRCVLGMNVSFEPPGSIATALCLTHAVLPKDGWLKEIGARGTWPMHGLMQCLHTDNGADFAALALQDGCNEYGISRIFRPPGKPQFGGGIERSILTLVLREQWLPGATYSRTLKRRPKNVETSAALTLEDLRRVISNDVCRYHWERHRELDKSPATAWQLAWEGTSGPRVPQDPHLFLMSFLPTTYRVVTREGIDLFGLEYWDAALRDYIAPGEKNLIRFDPRDLSAIFFRTKEAAYLRIPLRDARMPQFSLYEWREIKKRDRQRHAPTTDPEIVVDLLRANAKIVDDAVSLKERRRSARRRDWPNQLNAHLQPSASEPSGTDIVPSTAHFEILE